MSLMMPKKVKHRKAFRGKSKGIARRGNELNFGTYGLKGMETKWITSRQIESARRAIVRYLKKGGRLWIRIFPAKPVTTKGAEVPMGGGKGSVDHYVFPATPGRIFFEIEGIKEEDARAAFRKASDKLPIKTKFITR
ncbi:MAG: 50S ribosomal protein L16 [Candidatus Pacebacteria bacterium]|nr:50S ribosomal protein L16 [Candidatus Paceibacterota bacterium]